MFKNECEEEQRMVSYATVDADGKLISTLSSEPHKKQDPASTTKVWTLYTFLTLANEGRFKSMGIDNAREFIKENKDDILYMMTKSSNYVPYRLAWKYGHALLELPQTPSGTPPVLTAGQMHYPDTVNLFVEEMNRIAQTAGLNGTRFSSPHGHPGGLNLTEKSKPAPAIYWPTTKAHYSTAHDMALMIHRFNVDFHDFSDVLKQADYHGSVHTAHDVLNKKTVDIAKTGFSEGFHGDAGKYALTAANRYGAFAVAGAATKKKRTDTILRLAEGVRGGSIIPLPIPRFSKKGEETMTISPESEPADRSERKWAISRWWDGYNDWADKNPLTRKWGVGILGVGIFAAIASWLGTPSINEQGEPEHGIISSIFAPIKSIFSILFHPITLILGAIAGAAYYFKGDEIKEYFAGNGDKMTSAQTTKVSLSSADMGQLAGKVGPLCKRDDIICPSEDGGEAKTLILQGPAAVKAYKNAGLSA